MSREFTSGNHAHVTSETGILGGSLKGIVVSITDAGDAVTDISIDQLAAVPTDDRVSIMRDGHVTSRIFPADHQQAEMTFLVVQGESGFLELLLVGDSASAFLGFKPGSVVALKW